jgi:hypothetical protein
MRDSYCHGFRLDKPIRIAVDNIFGKVNPTDAFYIPIPPPESDFLLSDGTNLLLSDATNFLLSS